jgi:hypothetical protein
LNLTTDKVLIPANVDIAIGPGFFQIVNFQLLDLFLYVFDVSLKGLFLHQEILEFGGVFVGRHFHLEG